MLTEKKHIVGDGVEFDELPVEGDLAVGDSIRSYSWK
jgi:hypothetical protein